MKIIKSSIGQIKTFNTTYALGVYTVNPFSKQRSLGPFSFRDKNCRGYGFNLLILGINIKRCEHWEEEEVTNGR